MTGLYGSNQVLCVYKYHSRAYGDDRINVMYGMLHLKHGKSDVSHLKCDVSHFLRFIGERLSNPASTINFTLSVDAGLAFDFEIE